MLRCIIHQQCMAYFIFSFGISPLNDLSQHFCFHIHWIIALETTMHFHCFAIQIIKFHENRKKNIFKLICVQEWGEKTTKVVDVYGNTINRKSSLIICYFSFFFFSSLRHIFFRLLYSQHFSLLFLLWMNEWHFTRRFRMKKQFFFCRNNK